MRQYQPIEASQPKEGKYPSRRVAHRPKQRESASDAVPAVEPPRVLARIPNLADEGGESVPECEDSQGAVGNRGSRLSLRILAGGVIVLLAVALKPMVWPLVSGDRTPATVTKDEPPRWPASPTANRLPAPKSDGKTSLPTTWQNGNARPEPAQPEEPNSEEIPGFSASPWDQPAGQAPRRDPMPWRTQAGQSGPMQPDRWPQDREVQDRSQYQPSDRTAARPQYAGEPRPPARFEDRPNGIGGPPATGYPQFTNPDVRADRSPSASYRGYAPATGRQEPARPTNSPATAPRWDYPSTDRTGREPPARPSWGPSSGTNPALGDGDSAADPGAARLEGYIENPNVRTSYERIGPSVY